MVKTNVSLPLTIKIIYEKEAKSAPFVAYSPELDISSCGPTEEKAVENLHEAIELTLSGAAEDGTLESLLKDSENIAKKENVSIEKVKINNHAYFYNIHDCVWSDLFTGMFSRAAILWIVCRCNTYF